VLNDHRRLSPRRFASLWLLLLALPFIVSACITVENDLTATATPAAGSAAPAVESSPTQAPLASPTPTPSPVPTPEPVEAQVVAFMPNWLIEEAADGIDSELVTVAAFHSIEASGDGRLVSRKPSGDVPPGWRAMESDTFAELKQTLQNDGVKVVPVIQRNGWTEGTMGRTEALLGSKKARRDLAKRIARFVTLRGFDGVNLDFEPMPEKLADEYVDFVRALRTALDGVGDELHLSVDVTPNLTGYDLAALTAEGAADLAIIMGYGYRTEAAGVAGSTAPLVDPQSGDLSTTVTDALAQVSPEQLVLALPWYGVSWSTETDKARSTTLKGQDVDGGSEPPYAAAIEQAAVSGRRYQPEQASAWTSYPTRKCSDCPAVWRQLWYDDADSFGSKIDLALEQRLAGVGIWALGMEDGREEMWWTLRDRLRPRLDETPPHGSAALDPEALRGDLEGRDVVEGEAPLRLFAADAVDGSGLMLARIGLTGEVDGRGRLVTARSYPAVERIVFPLGDTSTGGSAESGPRSIHVQWRDIAGNWSMPLVIEAWVIDPLGSRTPDDL
jgi:spore germination protein YaaH